MNTCQTAVSMRLEHGWGLCPACGKHLVRLTADTRAYQLPVYCKRCKAEFIVNIEQACAN